MAGYGSPEIHYVRFRVFSFLPRLVIALYLLLAVSAQAAAMTVYDVIQLSKKSYSDEGIIALIETTDSAFELKADDIPRLVELGVSEPVIQAMLKAVPAEPPVESAPDRAPGQYVGSRVEHKSAGGAANALVGSEKTVPRAKVDSELLTEPGSGGHHHRVINLSGIRLLVLRDEGGFPTVAARARAVVERLRGASAMEEGQFQPAHMGGRDAVVFISSGTGRQVTVVSVSTRDASAYQRRSGRRVTADLLAAYWSDLLTDYWSLALEGQPPVRLAALHEGEALQELYDGLDKSIGNDADRLSGAFLSLPKQERDHLLQLAVSVPRDFNVAEEHAGEAP